MRFSALASIAVATTLLAAPAASAAPRFRATLKAPTHHPRSGTRWYYSIKATNVRGKPIAARVTVQIVDTLGTAHPVQYDETKRNIVNRRFVGVFRDYVEWPARARGFPLHFRATVRVGRAVRILTYRVVPR